MRALSLFIISFTTIILIIKMRFFTYKIVHIVHRNPIVFVEALSIL